MTANYLGQTLLVDSSVCFNEIAAAMSALGWSREDIQQTRPTIEDEPEVASWTCGGLKPFVIYSFNPVVKMRVLDVATVPPRLRMAIAKKLPLISEAKISKLFTAPTPRERLQALSYARELERVDLLGRVNALLNDKDPLIRKEAHSVSERLQQIDAARISLLTNLRMLSETAPQLIMQLRNPKFVTSLKPTPEELAKLFDPCLTEHLVSIVDTIYKTPPVLSDFDARKETEVCAAPAGLLRWPNMFSEKFPGGYRDIAGWMHPSPIWLSWTESEQGKNRISYDGLVWLESRWLWLPKIFRFVIPYLSTSAQSTQRH